MRIVNSFSAFRFIDIDMIISLLFVGSLCAIINNVIDVEVLFNSTFDVEQHIIIFEITKLL